MKIKKILLEITLDQALSVLDLKSSDLGDLSKLKTAYRNASLKYHPDKGGTVEQQQNVNAAYELLQKYKGSTPAGKFDWEANDRENYEMGKRILEQLKATINPKNFTDYFKGIYNTTFNFEIKNERPTGEFKKYGSYYFAGFSIIFFDAEKDIVFTMDVRCNISDAKRTSSLGSGQGNISYNLSITSYGLFNNKKLKLSARDWKMTTNHDTLIQPELTFPAEKLNKFKKTSITKQFKRADMLTLLKNKTDMNWDGEFFRLKKENLMLRFDRGTMFKQPYWTINLFEGAKGVPGMEYITLPETIETANFLINLSKQFNAAASPDAAKNVVKSEIVKKKLENKK